MLGFAGGHALADELGNRIRWFLCSWTARILTARISSSGSSSVIFIAGAHEEILVEPERFCQLRIGNAGVVTATRPRLFWPDSIDDLLAGSPSCSLCEGGSA
jgi:hypothetical protein